MLEATAAELVADATVEELLDRIAAKAGEALDAAGYLLAVRLPAGGRHLQSGGTGAGLISALDDDGLRFGGHLSDEDVDVITAPVALEKQSYGVLAAACREGGSFPQEAERALAAYARHAAARLNTEAWVVEARDHSQSATLLLQLAQALVKQSTIASVAASVAEAIPALVNADRSAVMTWHEESNELRVAGMSGWRGELAERFAVHATNVADSPELSEVVSQGKPLLIDRRGSEWANSILEEFDISAFAAAPIIAGNGLTGLVVACWTGATPECLNAVQTERLTGLSCLAAVGLYNVRLLQHTRHQACHDPMTGLPNRALLENRLEAALGRAAREGRQVGVLFCDINRFKRINDSLGHAGGDAALRHIAAQLTAAVRPEATVSRYSGDKFVILLPDVDSEMEVQLAAHRVRDNLTRGIVVGGRDIVVEVAIGSAIGGIMRREENAEPLERKAQRLIERAEAEMHRTKASSLGLAAPEAAGENTLQLETDLRGAADRGELRVLYQPQIDVSTRTVVGVEALVRWQHPALGLLAPSQFIALAEASSLIMEVGAYVLEEACRVASALRDKGHHLDMSVNVSPAQLGHPDFPDLVRHTLARSGLPANALTLEITESQAVSGSATNEKNLHDLRALGIDISIDDFGTGFSSLAQLHRLPVTEVKIDQSFTGRLAADDETSAAFVAAIIGLGNELGLRVVAEGVETTHQLNALAVMGCHRAQGYLIGKPGELISLENLLNAAKERREAPASERTAQEAAGHRWALLRDIPGTLADVIDTARNLGFRTESANETEIRIQVPGSILKRRRPSTLAATLLPIAGGTEVVWDTGTDYGSNQEHLLAMEERLPEDTMYDHGVKVAVNRAGLPKPALADVRNIVRLLNREEAVRTIGLGRLADQEGYVILTGQRLLMVPTPRTRHTPLLNVSLRSIEKLSMGKRSTGETIRFVVAHRTTEISSLGHGEGYEIAQVYRKIAKELAG